MLHPIRSWHCSASFSLLHAALLTKAGPRLLWQVAKPLVCVLFVLANGHYFGLCGVVVVGALDDTHSKTKRLLGNCKTERRAVVTN